MPFLQLLVLLVTLVLLGEALRRAVCRFTTFSQHLDSLQTLLLDVYLGGGLLYGVFLLPFHIYSNLTIRIILLLAVACVALLTGLRLGRPGGLPSLRWPRSLAEWAGPATAVAVAGLFLLLLWVLLLPTRSFVYGSIFDTSLHALFARVIQENRGLPLTLEPYEPTGITYPLGAHSLFAYASYLLDWATPYTVFKVTPLFLALSAPGGYFLGKALVGRGFGLALAFAIGFVTVHPAYITWGANPTALAFPLVLVTLGLLPWLVKDRGKKWADYLVVGLLLGYLASIYPPGYAVVLGIGTLWWVYEARKRGNFRRELVPYLWMVGASLLPPLPVGARSLWWFTLPGHNIGLPPDVVNPKWIAGPQQGVGWAYEALNLYAYAFLRYLALALAGWGFATILFIESSGRWRALYLAASVFAFSHFLVALRPLPLFDSIVGASINTFAFISLAILIAWAFQRIPAALARLPRGATMVSFSLIVLLAAPFVYTRIARDPALLKGHYGNFAVTRTEDRDLMLWMKSNLPQDAVVLVNPFEPGMLLTSLTQTKVVYAFTMTQFSASYQTLYQELKQGPPTPSSYQTMKNWGITHLYIGSRAAFWWEGNKKWPPEPVLHNPNFRLVKRIGDAYLFAVTYAQPGVIFQGTLGEPEDWTLYVPEELKGKGSASLEVKQASPGPRLVLRSEKRSGEFYWASYYTLVPLGEALNPRFSFSMETPQGFGPGDRLEVALSSPDWKERLIFITPDTPDRGKDLMLVQRGRPQKFDLGQLWQEVHGATLPKSLFLQVASYDSDGVPNVGYFDGLTFEWGD